MDIGCEYTRFSNDDYLESLEEQYDQNNVAFLSGDDNWFRKKTYISYSRLLKYSVFLDIELSLLNIKYENIDYDNAYDVMLNFRYNISK